jgi:hypothetical protein
MKLSLLGSASAAIALTGGLVAGCSSATDPTNAESEAASARQWGLCPDGIEPPEDGPTQLQCATVPVPLNCSDPEAHSST